MMGGCLFSHLLGVIGFSEPCDTENQRQGLCPQGSPGGEMSSHTEGRRGTGPSERAPGPQSSRRERTLPVRQLGGALEEGVLRWALLE